MGFELPLLIDLIGPLAVDSNGVIELKNLAPDIDRHRDNAGFTAQHEWNVQGIVQVVSYVRMVSDEKLHNTFSSTAIMNIRPLDVSAYRSIVLRYRNRERGEIPVEPGFPVSIQRSLDILGFWMGNCLDEFIRWRRDGTGNIILAGIVYVVGWVQIGGSNPRLYWL